MSDAPSPGRRPRPRPGPADAPEAATTQSPASEAPASEAPTSEAPTSEAPTSEAPTTRPRTASRTARRKAARKADQQTRLRRLRTTMIVALVVAVAAGAASVIVAFAGGGDGSSKHSRSTAASAPAGAGAVLANTDQATAFLAAASADVAAVTNYDYRRLDDALQAGLGVTTGAYRTAFQQAMTGDQAAATKAQQVVHQFQVLDLGLGQVNAAGTQAKVLIFGRQLATDRNHSQPQAAVVTLCATVVRQGSDRYLVAALDQDGEAGVPPGSSELGRAVEAARAEVVNALSFTRAQFDADEKRAEAGATDPLRGQLAAQAPKTKQAMDKGGYDLTGVVVSSAVKAADGSTVQLMVAADSTRAGGGSDVTQIRYDVTVNLIGGSWLVSQLRSLPDQ